MSQESSYGYYIEIDSVLNTGLATTVQEAQNVKNDIYVEAAGRHLLKDFCRMFYYEMLKLPIK